MTKIPLMPQRKGPAYEEHSKKEAIISISLAIIIEALIILVEGFDFFSS